MRNAYNERYAYESPDQPVLSRCLARTSILYVHIVQILLNLLAGNVGPN